MQKRELSQGVSRREGHSVLPLVFQTWGPKTQRLLGVWKVSAHLLDPRGRPGQNLPATGQCSIFRQRLPTRSHLPREPLLWGLFGSRASRIVDSALFMPPERGGTPGFISLQNSCWFLTLSSSRVLCWAFSPRVFTTSPWGGKKSREGIFFLTHCSMWQRRLEHSPESEWHAW